MTRANQIISLLTTSLSAIAAAIGRSRSTVGNYVHELVANGRLHKNGHGWEILENGD